MKRTFAMCLSIAASVIVAGLAPCASQTRTQPATTSQAPAQTQPAGASQNADATQPAPFKPEELEQLAAPIALYPDDLLAQVFMASTYPLEIVMAARWSKEHPEVKGDAVAKEMEKQSWDPSVKSLVAFPQVLGMMSEKLDWTQKLGDAVLAQRKDLMDAVQRLRIKAKESGHLNSGTEQIVKTEPAPEGSANPQVVIIESADPEVVYVPTYNPTVVYGAWPYPAYPPYYYYPPGYVAGTAFFSFSAGVFVGSALWGGCNWGYSDFDVNVNRYNSFNRTNISADANRAGNRQWQHDSQHRQGVGYRDTATQQKYGRASSQEGLQAREEFRGRADQGREQLAREGSANQRDLGGNQLATRDGSGTGYGDSGYRDLGGQTRDLGGTQEGSFDSAQNRDRAASQSRTAADASSRSKSSDAFRGVGDGASTRAQSSRGMSSRGGMSRGSGGRRR